MAEARRDYMDESGGRYVQVIADGGMGDSGSFVKALASARRGHARRAAGPRHRGPRQRHPLGFRSPPPGRVATATVGTVGPLEQVLFGPSHQADGKTNFIGALKRAMASTGYVDEELPALRHSGQPVPHDNPDCPLKMGLPSMQEA